ncbi:MAG TPA: hypothetical protein VK806_09655 [Bacteroidia bacterium]|jgi:hypothetical protein|nr:hypothetical protein [Bacteroidia bacterium]
MKPLLILILSLLFSIAAFGQKDSSYLFVSSDSINNEKVRLDKIFAADNIKVTVLVSGCFFEEHYSIWIQKIKKGYAFRSVDTLSLTKIDVRIGKLSKEDVQSMKALFVQGLTDRGCFGTTSEHFNVEADNRKIAFRYFRCEYSPSDLLDRLKFIVWRK